MRWLLLSVLLIAGCNGAARLGPEAPEAAWSLGFPPDQPKLASTNVHHQQIDGIESSTRTEKRGPGVNHTELSEAELAAQTSWKLIGSGIFLVLVGIALMWGSTKTLGLIPTWAGRAVIGLGAGLIVWGSVTPGTRDMIVIGIVALIVLWMYYGSKNSNTKILNGHGKDEQAKKPVAERTEDEPFSERDDDEPGLLVADDK